MAVFHPVRAPTPAQLQALLTRLIKRLMRLLTRQGYLVEEQGMTYLADPNPESALTPLQAAACTYLPAGRQAASRLKHPSLDWPATFLLLRRLRRSGRALGKTY